MRKTKRQKLKKSGKIILFALILGFVLIAYFAFDAFKRNGEFTRLFPRFDGTCTNFAGFIGAEDLEYDANGKQIFVSSFDRRSKNANQRGAIYAIAENAQSTSPIDLTNSIPQNFKPLGLSIWTDNISHQQYLGIINRQESQSSVEIYRIIATGLEHKKSIPLGNIERPNDLVLVSENQFYLTNESTLKFKSTQDAFGMLFNTDKSGSIEYFDGVKFSNVAGGLGFANSIAISKDGSKIYASATYGRNLKIFTRNSNGSLVVLDDVYLGTGVDNLSVDNDGRIFIAAHPRLLSTARYMLFGMGSPPSQIIVVEPSQNGKGGKIDQVYLTTGKDDFKAASVGVKVNNRLFIGSIYENAVRVCELPNEWHQSITHPANRLLDTERDNKIKDEEKARKKQKGITH